MSWLAARLKQYFESGPRYASLLLLGVALAWPSVAPARQVERRQVAIAETSLPAQARTTLVRISQGGPFPFAKDGIVFGNYEHQLPRKPRGYYHEYTVTTPGARSRGARRIVCGGPTRTPDICYYTHDHYASFQRIAR